MKLRSILFLVFIGLMAGAPAWASIELSKSVPAQGETIEITYKTSAEVKEDQSKSKELVFNGQSFKLFPISADIFHCLIAIPADLKTGKYPIKIGDEKCTITVKDGLFPVQNLTLPKSKDNFLLSPGEEEAMNAAKAALSDKRLWQGTFTKPCQARTSSKFGLKRVVNGKLLKDYYHSGLDFAGSLGQPVCACADGKVVLAHKNFRLHGNVVAIDHGQGVVSIYIHLQKIKVKEGDVVTAGEQIGNVGATGRANGPHLHLSLYVNKVATNPMPWFSKTF
jgi:murein DD-endopeptidase MepM/ murein hydrolase activator NlpD